MIQTIRFDRFKISTHPDGLTVMLHYPRDGMGDPMSDVQLLCSGEAAGKLLAELQKVVG